MADRLEWVRRGRGYWVAKPAPGVVLKRQLAAGVWVEARFERGELVEVRDLPPVGERQKCG